MASKWSQHLTFCPWRCSLSSLLTSSLSCLSLSLHPNQTRCPWVSIVYHWYWPPERLLGHFCAFPCLKVSSDVLAGDFAPAQRSTGSLQPGSTSGRGYFSCSIFQLLLGSALNPFQCLRYCSSNCITRFTLFARKPIMPYYYITIP